MANSSIPNSTPATGRISMPSSGRLRNLNKRSHRSWSSLRRSKFGVRCLPRRSRTEAGSAFSFLSAIRRVKGAWWPSRSSKPSSPRKWRGRFDSYPLRRFIFDFRFPIFDWSQRCAAEIQVPACHRGGHLASSIEKGGDLHVA